MPGTTGRDFGRAGRTSAAVGRWPLPKADQLGVYRSHTPNNGASRRQVNRNRPVSDSEDLRE
jgi:hypothetical protein